MTRWQALELDAPQETYLQHYRACANQNRLQPQRSPQTHCPDQAVDSGRSGDPRRNMAPSLEQQVHRQALKEQRHQDKDREHAVAAGLGQ